MDKGKKKTKKVKVEEVEEDAKYKSSLTVRQCNMLEALEMNKGIVKDACRHAGVSRQTHYNWIDKYEDYKFHVEMVKDIVHDWAESKLHSRMEKDDTIAIIFYAKTQMKKRGYVEKSEVEYSGEMPTTIISWGGKEIKV